MAGGQWGGSCTRGLEGGRAVPPGVLPTPGFCGEGVHHNGINTGPPPGHSSTPPGHSSTPLALPPPPPALVTHNKKWRASCAHFPCVVPLGRPAWLASCQVVGCKSICLVHACPSCPYWATCMLISGHTHAHSTASCTWYQLPLFVCPSPSPAAHLRPAVDP